MKLISHIYKSLKASDIKLLMFAFGMIMLMFSQNYVTELISEIEIENVLVEEYDAEKEEKSSTENDWEDELFSIVYNTSESRDAGLSRSNGFGDKKFSNSLHIIEIPLPPPEFIIV